MAADTAARSSLREILAERELLVAAAAPLLAARTAAEQQLQQRQRTAEELRRTAALAAHRSALVEGQPCPLCGALEHPAAGGDVRPELAQALAAVADAERMFAAAGSALAKNQADQKAMLRTIAGAQQRAEREGAACRAAEQAWRELAADDATLADRAPDALGAALATAGKQLAATAAAVEAEDERQQVVTVVLTTAVTAAAQADHDWEQATVRLQQQQAAARAAVAVRQAAVAEAAALAAAIDERTLLIGPAFGPVTDWQARLSRGSEAFVRALAAAARAHLVATASDAEMLRLRQQLAAAEQAATVQQTTAAAAQQQLAADLAAAAVERADVLLAQQTSTAAFDDATTAMAELATAVATARAVVQERVARRRQHQRTGRPELDAQEAGAALEEIRSARDVIDQRLAAAQGELLVDDHARRQRAELQPVLAAQRQRLQIWRALDDLIGSSTGDAFGVFAQSLTMDLLLAEANRRLAELARRYRLQRLRATDLDFGVLDLDLGGSLRSVRTLSGGESFLVSLALALALASLAAERTRIETLFLDEGFGTLDGASLETALAALDALQATGCQVGIISHVDSLAERIGVVVQVQPDGAGQSRVIVGA